MSPRSCPSSLTVFDFASQWIDGNTRISLREILTRSERPLHCKLTEYTSRPISAHSLKRIIIGKELDVGTWNPFTENELEIFKKLEVIQEKVTVNDVQAVCPGWPFGEECVASLPELVSALLRRDLALVNYVLSSTRPTGQYGKTTLQKGFSTGQNPRKKYPQIAIYGFSEGPKYSAKTLMPIVVRLSAAWDAVSRPDDYEYDNERWTNTFSFLRDYMYIHEAKYGCVISDEYIVVVRRHPNKYERARVLQASPPIPLISKPGEWNAKMVLWYIHHAWLFEDNEATNQITFSQVPAPTTVSTPILEPIEGNDIIGLYRSESEFNSDLNRSDGLGIIQLDTLDLPIWSCKTSDGRIGRLYRSPLY